MAIIPTIGIEIEVNWSAYFPREYADWFCDGERKYSDFWDSEKEEFDRVCTDLDSEMLPRITTVCNELGISRGKDAYWEFVFPPFSDVSEIIRIIEILHAHKVLPLWIPHALHLTIAGLILDTNCAVLATYLEILSGVTAERIRTGTHPKDSNFTAGWARRWNRGMRARPKEELLLGAERAVEFRTLVLPGTFSEIRDLLEFAQKYGEKINEIQNGGKVDVWWEIIQNLLAWKLSKYRLDLEADWGNPNTQIETWSMYGQFLDKESTTLLLSLRHGN